MNRLFCSFLTLVLCLFASITSAQAMQYQIRDMSDVLGNHAHQWDINNKNEIVGTKGDHAFYWDESAGFVDLGANINGQRSGARAINNAGKIVGFTNVSKVINGIDCTVTNAIMWDRNGNMTYLNALPGAVSSIAMDINDAGEILGTSTFETYITGYSLPIYSKHIVIWNADGYIIQDMGELFHGNQWAAWEFNNNGDIRGYNIGDNGPEHWVRHPDGNLTILNNSSSGYISVDSINNSGLVAGSLADEHSYFATVWNQDGSIRAQLSPLAGDEFTMAYDINDSGIVVGESSSDDNIHATLWNSDGTATFLGSLPGFEISRASMINNNGWIVGECGTYGDWRTVLWTPIPEPASLLALMCGIGGLILSRRKC